MSELPVPYYDRDGITIYCGDCRDIVPKLGRFDLLLTDPPYGIEWSGSNASTRQWEAIANDSNSDLAKWILGRVNDYGDAVVFGANCFPDCLPHRGRWVCWDKRLTESADKMLGSAFELAWVNRKTGFDRMFRVLHGGVVNADGGKRLHPTQKPVSLFRQIINDMFSKSKSVIDPFMGSGTTLVAAKELGIRAVGIELNEKYCEIAVKRLAQGVLNFESAST